MNFPQAISTCIQKYAVFSGRAKRSEYWYWALLTVPMVFILEQIDPFATHTLYGTFSIISTIFSLVIFLPTIAVTARRLHDTNKSGWWQLIAIIPILGIIVLIVFLAQKGSDEANIYDEQPPMDPESSATARFINSD